MKKFIVKVYIGLAVCALFAFTSATKKLLTPKVEVTPVNVLQPIVIEPINYVELDFGIKFKGHQAFLGDLGFMESSNDYSAVNRLGYMGRYQFGSKTLKSIGMKVTREEFLSNPQLQEEAMNRLLEANYKSLKRFIDKYEGKNLHGVTVTKSGVLAAAHLGGAGAVRKWFRKGHNFKDANGTSIVKYMTKFSGYQLNIS